MKGIAEGSLIRLLNGQERPIEELNNAFFKTPVYLYSLDKQGIVVGQVVLSYVGYGRTLKVILDDSNVLVVGEDQEFVMRDRFMRPAKSLKPNDALISLYREISENPRNKLIGYELCHDPILGRRRFTHRLVGRWKYPGQYPKNGYVVHYKDYKKLNNDPSNLVLMEKDEHIRLHQDFLRRLLENPEFKAFMREVSRENMSNNWRKPGWAEKVLQARLDAGQVELARELMFKNWKDPEFRARKSDEMSKNWEDPEWQARQVDVIERTFKNPEFIKENIERTKERWKDPEYRSSMIEKQRVVGKEKWQDPDYRRQMVEARRKRAKREKKEGSNSMTRLWKDPEFRTRMEEVGRQAVKKAWSDPEVAAKLRASRKARADAQHQANIDRGITFDTINDAIYCDDCNSLCKLGKYFDVAHTVITRILKRNGIENPSQYVRTYTNHRVLSVGSGGFSDLYSLSTIFSCKGVFLNGSDNNS